MSEKYVGGCLCGAIRYAVTEFFPSVANCHCQMCRKHTGSAFASYASVASDKFHLLSGHEYVKGFTAANGTTRTFCKECGSSLMFSSPQAPADIIELSLATLDGDSPVKPNAHIFTGYKANWFESHDNLPKYQEGRDSSGST